MASPASDAGRHLHLQHHYTESASEPAVREAQKWIEAVTGRSFGEKDFRGALDNGILLCELLSSVKPGLVKKINRLQTPIAGLDNLTLFLRGCEELGLKGSQLFDPGDLQDTASRTHNKASDCSRKLKNVLITIYWLGRAANSIATYNGPTLDLHEFEGLLSQMRKEGEEWDSPKRSIRDSGYIDCWESERSDSLSPPRHARDDSFDSLDSIGSRSRHTPSPDGLLARGSSDGRGSDSECDIPHRKLPDVRRDDMLARRTSCSEPRSAVPFNQYLPNKSNQTAYVPALLRRQHTDREDGRKSWSSATSPTGGERPFRFSHRSSISDDTESMSMIDMRNEDDVLLPAHSQVRHELMHSQYSRMKEDESHWQDDLARWKSRRRSVSQDLIKKEETRKMMEKLLNLDECPQRRRSIKTYREIVEDKERRERELHEAYLKAKTPEEAAAVLHRYAQRFTISEAILERLKLPRLLERSVSADPTRGPTSTCPSSPDDSVFSPTGPGPLRYLRQQSLPAPKFTASVEALVRTCGSQQGDAAGGGGTGASLLGPKPYGHSRAASCRETVAQQEMERVNGEAERNRWAESDREKDGERKREEDSPPPLFDPSPSRSAESDSDSVPSSDRRPSGTLAPAHTPTRSPKPERSDRADSEAVGQRNSEAVGQRIPGSEPQSREGEWTPSRPTFLLMQVPIEEEAVLQAGGVSLPLKEEEPRKEKMPESEWVPVEQSGRGLDSAVLSQNGTTRTTPDTQAPLRTDITAKPIGKPVLESPRKTSERPESASRIQSEPKPVCGIPAAELASNAQLASLSSNPKLRWDFFTSSEPAEKPHGNERYNREQEKLKQEWEKAQKEVEEEERKYHEEEKKILEETVAPLTPHSPMPPSPCWLDAAHPTGITTPHGIVRSLADWERKQQELENQMETLENKTQREHEKKETAGPSQMTGRLQQRTCDQLAGQHSGQRAEAAEQSKGVQQEQPGQDVSWSTKQHQQKQSSSKDLQNTAVVDSTRNTQPSSGGRRRSDSIEHVGVSQSASYTDTQQPPSSPNRSVSGKKLCSSCGNPLGKGAAMIIETLSLYFHIQCFKCGICKGQLGDTATGTDVRIRNGLLNCHQCYIRSRTAGQPTTL